MNEPEKEETGNWAPRTIVVGYDGGRSAERALMHALALARRFDSRLVVADVAGPQSLQGTPGGFGYAPYYALTGPDPGARIDEALRHQRRASIDSQLTRSGVRHEFVSLVGEPVVKILKLADQQDADLIVVGTPELSLLARLLEGATGLDVARHAHRDVLIVHASHSKTSA